MVLCGVTWILFLYATTLYFAWLAIVDLGPDAMAPFRVIEVGMTEADVREQVGPPDYTYSVAEVPEDYYIAGYACEEREVTNRLLIWEGVPAQVPMGWYVVYVYIDPQGRVEHMFIGQD